MQKFNHYRINQEIIKMNKLAESLESWLTQNVGHRDWEKVNRYLLSDKIAGKLLMQLSGEELVNLRKKLHSITDKNAIKQSEIARLSILN